MADPSVTDDYIADPELVAKLLPLIKQALGNMLENSGKGLADNGQPPLTEREKILISHTVSFVVGTVYGAIRSAMEVELVEETTPPGGVN